MKKDALEISAKLFCRAILLQVMNQVTISLFEEDITQTQKTCLRFIYCHSQPSVSEIAKGLSISNAAATNLIDRLVKKDLLRRDEDPLDRRVLKITLSPKGAEMIHKINSLESQYFNEIIARMPQRAVTALEEALPAFLKAALLTPEEIDEICLRCGWEHILNCPGNVRFRELTGRDRKKI